MTIIRVGTRGSKLALAQARPMVDVLRDQGIEIEWREFTTSGDIRRRTFTNTNEPDHANADFAP